MWHSRDGKKTEERDTGDFNTVAFLGFCIIERSRVSKKHHSFGLLNIIIIAILMLFGVLLWLFWQGGVHDFYTQCVQLNESLNSILVKNNITDRDVQVQSRQERRQGISVWVEYYREVTVPQKADFETIKRQVAEVSTSFGLDCTITQPETDRYDCILRKNNMVFARMLFTVPSLITVESDGKKKVAIIIDDAGSRKDISALLNLKILV